MEMLASCWMKGELSQLHNTAVVLFPERTRRPTDAVVSLTSLSADNGLLSFIKSVS